MKSVLDLSCQLIGAGIGVAIAGPLGIATALNPRQLSQRVTPITSNIRSTRDSSNIAPSTYSEILATSLLISKGVLGTSPLTPFPPDAVAVSSSATRRSPRASTRHPLVWIPSILLLGFAIGLIRQVRMSLANGKDDRNRTRSSSRGLDTDSGRDANRYSKGDYSDAGDFGDGSSGEEEKKE